MNVRAYFIHVSKHKIVQLYKVTKSKKITPTFHYYLSVRTSKVKTK